MLRGRSQFFRRPREHSAAHRSHTANDLPSPSPRKVPHQPTATHRDPIPYEDAQEYTSPAYAPDPVVVRGTPSRPPPSLQQFHQQHHSVKNLGQHRKPQQHAPQSQSYPHLPPRRPGAHRAVNVSNSHVRDGDENRHPPTPSQDRIPQPRSSKPERYSAPQRDFFKWSKRRGQILRSEAPVCAPHIAGAPRGSSRRLSIRPHGPIPGAGLVTYNDQPKALVPLRYSNADVHVAGWLSKRGKRLGSRVERFLVLHGSMLSNARQEGARPTWAVNIRGCKVLSGPNREIIFKVNNNFSSFYAPDDIVHAKWIDALQSVSAVVTDFYDFGKLIGRGAYSEVFLARDQLRSELCAVKVLDRVDREPARLIDRELKVLRLLNNKNLVRTYDIFDTPAQTYVVMEYLAGGELLDMITDNDHLSERNAKHVLKQVLEAVLYLHNKGIVHRDVKPENILCVSRNFPLRVKLTDFGLSKVVSAADGKSADAAMRSQCGTAYYLAPEIVNNVSYGKPVDMWACGVVGYVMLAGKFPFYGDTDEKFMKRLRAGVSFPNKEWRSISQNAKSLIRGLLDPNPETRLTAEQALQHRWLNDELDVVSSSSKPSVAVGDARDRELLQYQAHNESLSLQLCNFAPSKTRRKAGDMADGLAEDDDEDLVLRTEEMVLKGSALDYYSTPLSHEYAGSDDESTPLVARGRVVHVDPPLASVRARAAEV